MTLDFARFVRGLTSFYRQIDQFDAMGARPGKPHNGMSRLLDSFSLVEAIGRMRVKSKGCYNKLVDLENRAINFDLWT